MIKPTKLIPRLLAAAVASLPFVAGPALYGQVDLRDGLVAYWEFENNFEDSIGVFDGTEMGSVSIPFVDGKAGFGKAGKFDGEDQFVEITGGEPDDLAFAGESMTVAGWFKADAFDTDWQALVAKGEGTNWRVHRRGAEGGLAHSGGVGEGPVGTDVTLGEWHHFAALTDVPGNRIALYVDGVLYSENPVAPVLAANGLRMRIADNPGAVGREWEGEIDDIALWNRALSQAEIEALYAGGTGKALSAFFGTQIEVLGVDATSLLGADLTDPEGDGDEAAGAADPSWNWVGITSSHEPFFDGGEGAFNIFDNQVGGGVAKWCCDDPTPGNPVWVAVQFPRPVSITHFTITSGNDSPDRDPTDFAIQGSDDGASWTDIYHFTDTTVPWTERNQVVKFTLAQGSTAYRHIRYVAFATPGTLHQINEVELFGNFGGSVVAFISGVRGGVNSFSFIVNDDGPSVVDPASVKLSLDGVNVPLGTLTKTDGKINVSHTTTAPFLPGSTHAYAITGLDGNGNTISAEGEFTVPAYALLTAGDRVTGDTTKPGFIFNVHQNSAFQATDNVRPVEQLAGRLGINHADPFAQGPALAQGVPGANENLPLFFEVPGVINMNQDAPGEIGNFNFSNGFEDQIIPGIPGIEFSTDGIAAEILTFIELPAGLTTMIFNSDDGFITTAGNLEDIFDRQVAGLFGAGRGAADTVFQVYAESAGFYPFRTIWNEGGGGANLEWITVKADGTKVLVNDTANGGLRAVRAATGQAATAITRVSPTIGNTKVLANAPIEVVIREGAQAVDNNSIRFVVNGVEATPTVNKVGSEITARLQPAAAFALNSSNTVEIRFMAGGAQRTESLGFFVPPVTVDKVASRAGLILGPARHTAAGGGRSGAATDHAMDLGRVSAGAPSVLVPDAAFLNSATAAGDDTLTFALWIKKYDIAASSAFWADSPSSPSGMRGFQAHTPWSDNTVYFDSSGCCDADITRISLPMAGWPSYDAVGDISWWTNTWRHFVFVKDGITKNIYVDGELFHTGFGDPLKTDFARIWIGAEGGGPDRGVANNMHGQVDDFAIYGTALSAAQVTQLAGGTLPNALPAAAQLLAYWDFNDAPAPSADRPTITLTRSATGTSLSWPAAASGFRLFSSDIVNGTYTEVTGVTGTSFVVPSTASGTRFYILRQN